MYWIRTFNDFHGIIKSIKIMVHLIMTLKDSIKVMVYLIKTFIKVYKNHGVLD